MLAPLAGFSISRKHSARSIKGTRFSDHRVLHCLVVGTRQEVIWNTDYKTHENFSSSYHRMHSHRLPTGWGCFFQDNVVVHKCKAKNLLSLKLVLHRNTTSVACLAANDTCIRVTSFRKGAVAWRAEGQGSVVAGKLIHISRLRTKSSPLKPPRLRLARGRATWID